MQPQRNNNFLRNSLPSDLEAIAAILSGAIAEPTSGLAGIAGAILPGPKGQGASWVGNVQNAMSYQPNNPKTLNQIGSALQMPMELYEKGTNWLGDTALDATGSPAAATAAKSLPEIIGGGFALKQLGKSALKNSANKPQQPDAPPEDASRRKFIKNLGLGAAGLAVGSKIPGKGLMDLIDAPAAKPAAAAVLRSIPNLSPDKYIAVQTLKSLTEGMKKADADALLDDIGEKGYNPVFKNEPFAPNDIDFGDFDMKELAELAKKDKVHISDNIDHLPDGRDWIDPFNPVDIEFNRGTGSGALYHSLFEGIVGKKLDPSSFKDDLRHYVSEQKDSNMKDLHPTHQKIVDDLLASDDPVGDVVRYKISNDLDITGTVKNTKEYFGDVEPEGFWVDVTPDGSAVIDANGTLKY